MKGDLIMFTVTGVPQIEETYTPPTTPAPKAPPVDNRTIAELIAEYHAYGGKGLNLWTDATPKLDESPAATAKARAEWGF